MKKSLFLIMIVIFSLDAADRPKFIKLPAYRSPSGIITIESVDINQKDKAVGKTFKSLINEAQEDNTSWRMVAYWCKLNGSLIRCYASAKTVNVHPHHDMMRACEYYQIEKQRAGTYNVMRVLLSND